MKNQVVCKRTAACLRDLRKRESNFQLKNKLVRTYVSELGGLYRKAVEELEINAKNFMEINSVDGFQEDKQETARKLSHFRVYKIFKKLPWKFKIRCKNFDL